MKTRNPTESSPWNDPINRRMHGFSFPDFEDKDDVQDVISPHSFNQFSISSTPLTWKCIKKEKKSNDSWIVVSRQFDFVQKSKGKFHSRRIVLFKEKLGVTVGSNGPSQSMVQMKRR